MSKYQNFIFKSYEFDQASKTLSLHYAYDDDLSFTETFTFDFDFAAYNPEAFDKACQILFFIAGVSYYKAFLAPKVVVEAGDIDATLSKFLSETYEKGLGEFFYVNQLDPATTITFPVTTNETLNMLSVSGEGSVVGIGGGKDSLVSVEILRDEHNPTTWSLDHQAQLQPLIERIGLPHLCVRRQWDEQLLSLPAMGAYRGHVPISAIFAAAGTIAAILSGKRDVVVSNEQSANEETLTYKGVSINHQYSKTSAFEESYQALLQHYFGDSLRYYSLLRPLSELRICELFAETAFEKYKDVFSSCNRAFVHTSDHMSWCGECPKCTFAFLALTPFIKRTELEALWGKNLLLDPALESTYRQLLGIEGDKPLDCVGEVKESRSAMQLAFEIYPELADKYHFELPEGYNFRTISPHLIPSEIFAQIESKI